MFTLVLTMRNFIFFVLIALASYVKAQDLPYSWSTDVVEKEGGAVLAFTCKVDSGWHIYPFAAQGDIGVPTDISFVSHDDFSLEGEMSEPKPHTSYDSLFEVDISYHEGKVVFTQEVKKLTSQEIAITVNIKTQACQDDGVCTIPGVQSFEIKIPADEGGSQSAFWVFWAGLTAGLIALFTPCVFPMMPMTVTFFTKQAVGRSGGVLKAFVYGISIVVIYVSMGIGITLAFGEEALYNMASSATFNLAFFVLLVFFAVSFLGAFEITIPSAFVNKVDSKADKGGWIGIFFMAFALALVSFSCTGPIIGTLIVQTSLYGGGLGPFVGMLGFGIGLAFPFTLFAVFPSWLNKLPKSGGWLNSVKVVLGLLELALAFKFLSNADLVYQAHWLTREVFIAIWIAIAVVLVLYLLGKIRFPHDSELKVVPVSRGILAMFFIGLIVYMLPGMWGAPLKLFSGILPPTYYTEGWQLGQSERDGKMKNNKNETCPNGLDCYHDYDQGLKIAKEQGKPLLLDFTGYTCPNCRKVEENVWSNPEIDKLIRDDFILVSLYVDSKKELPESEVYVSQRNGEKVLTYGGKWADMEIQRFGEFTQPLYVVVDHQEKPLSGKISYTSDVEEYKSFLQRGLDAFKIKK